MFLKPHRWFRARPAASDGQSGTIEPLARNTVIDYADEADGFTHIDVRPLTYAEVAHSDFSTRKMATTPYSIVDESKLAVQMVEEYEAANSVKPKASAHVMANIEYGADSYREPPRSRKRRNRSKDRR